MVKVVNNLSEKDISTENMVINCSNGAAPLHQRFRRLSPDKRVEIHSLLNAKLQKSFNFLIKNVHGLYILLS